MWRGRTGSELAGGLLVHVAIQRVGELPIDERPADQGRPFDVVGWETGGTALGLDPVDLLLSNGHARAGAALYVAHVDPTLLADGTYFVHDVAGEIVACGGWSRRGRLYTGSGHGEDDDRLLDPATRWRGGRSMTTVAMTTGVRCRLYASPSSLALWRASVHCSPRWSAS